MSGLSLKLALLFAVTSVTGTAQSLSLLDNYEVDPGFAFPLSETQWDSIGFINGASAVFPEVATLRLGAKVPGLVHLDLYSGSASGPYFLPAERIASFTPVHVGGEGDYSFELTGSPKLESYTRYWLVLYSDTGAQHYLWEAEFPEGLEYASDVGADVFEFASSSNSGGEWDPHSGATLLRMEGSYADVPQYTVSVSANDTAAGSVSGSGVYPQGTTLSLTASAVDGYVFAGWTQAVETAQNPVEVEVTGNLEVVGIFLPDEADDDGDGLSNHDEYVRYGTSPANVDTDGDGIRDGLEIDFSADPLHDDTALLNIIKAEPSLAGLFSAAELKEAAQQARNEVIADPSSVGLYAKADVDAAVQASRASIIEDPASVGLFASQVAYDIRLGDSSVRHEGDLLSLKWTLMRSQDLSAWKPVGELQAEIQAPEGSHFFTLEIEPK